MERPNHRVLPALAPSSIVPQPYREEGQHRSLGFWFRCAGAFRVRGAHHAAFERFGKPPVKELAGVPKSGSYCCATLRPFSHSERHALLWDQHHASRGNRQIVGRHRFKADSAQESSKQDRGL